MINIDMLKALVANKTTRATANKAKKINDSWFVQKTNREIENGLSFSEHAKERIAQRFQDIELDNLAAAISRAIRSIKVDTQYNYKKKAIKFSDSQTGFVIILERYGNFGANIVTAYVNGRDNLLSDNELKFIKKWGL